MRILKPFLTFDPLPIKTTDFRTYSAHQATQKITKLRDSMLFLLKFGRQNPFPTDNFSTNKINAKLKICILDITFNQSKRQEKQDVNSIFRLYYKVIIRKIKIQKLHTN